MALLPLKLPAGLMQDGTEFENSNVWREGNLVRWVSGSLRPVGGWQLRNAAIQASNLKYGDYDPTAINDDTDPSYSGATTTGVGYGNNFYGGQQDMGEPPRAMLAWSDNSGDARIVIGSANVLYSINENQQAFDITPSAIGGSVDLAAGNVDAAVNVGFGGNFYGTGYYGMPRPNSGTFLECTTWSLENWGEYLLACASTDGRILEWQLDTGVDPAVVANAPTDNGAILVTEERFVFALGGKKSGEAVRNPRRVVWCDREDNTSWTPSATNEAGDLELQTQGEIMCGLRVRGRSLILTNEDAHLATYQGPPYVYGFERAGTSCGVIGRKAAVQAKEGAFWMGHSSFFAFNGSVAQKIACPITDHVFNDLNYNQSSKVYAIHNNKFGEVWWFYPSGNNVENDSYVSYNYVENYWSYGKLARTCGIDAGVFDTPIWAGTRGNLYSHEFGHRHEDVDGSYHYPWVESGPISLGNGDQVMRVTDLIPDEKTQGDVRLIFKSRFHPNDTERNYGPFDPSNPTSVRFTGRQIRMRIEAAVEFDDVRRGLINAANAINPEKGLFVTTKIGTRSLGDITNSGSVTTADADAYQAWLDDTLTDPDQKLYIEEVLNPYMLANTAYDDYLYRNANDWRVGNMRIEASGGGRR